MVEVTFNALINGLLYGSIWGVIALGFTLIFGVMDFVNFAQGFFVVVPAYFSFLLFTRWGIDPYVSLILVTPVSFALGLLVYRYLGARLLDEPHTAHIIVTLGLCFFIENGVLLLAGGDLRSAVTSYTSESIRLGALIVSYPRLWASLIAWACVIGLFLFLKYTNLGKSMRAAADNREGAKIVGIYVDRVYLIAFGLSFMIAGMTGAVMIPFYLMNPFTGMDFLGKAFAAVIIGGLGSIPGAIVGGLIIGVVESIAGVFLKASLGNALTFFIVILVLIFKPSGLFTE
ncbi:MAG: branched-chain amino acid ABC transporter permease [Deltaproteobacteria bacterium]|nr:MAG: branched-chain amino acid ABC transporter permease [Deltaproteobacteria bacterium]